MKKWIAACALLVLFGLFAMAERQTQPAPAKTADSPRTFHVRGTVVSVNLADRSLRIRHEAIPGYMPAMTMPFKVNHPTLLAEAQPGDVIDFDFNVTSDDSWISSIKPVSDTAPVTPSPEPSVTEDDVNLIATGERFPDFELLDQDGHTFHLRDFAGQAVVITFIYTRCPVPNFCPLMSKKFLQLRDALDKRFGGRYHLLSITMDPRFDRPAVLKKYGSRYITDFNHWTFATGSDPQIKSVATSLGLHYFTENGLVSHDLRTALIGPDGRLEHVWKSNGWQPREVEERITRIMGNQLSQSAE